MKTNVIFIAILSLIIIGCGENGNKSKLEESGTVETTKVLISSERAGKIKNINFEEGSNVKTGDTLMVIDHELLLIKLKQTKAAEKMAYANLQLFKKGARTEDKKSASKQLTQAELNYESAKKNYERFKNLFEEKVITLKQYEDAETNYKLCEAKLISAKANYEKIKNLIRPEELLKAEANFEQTQARTLEVKKNIKDSFILSPMNGTIVKQYSEVGETVNRMSSLLKISDLSKVEIVIYVSETDLGKIKIGQQAEIKTDTFPDKIYNGAVKYISPEAEFTPKNVQTKDERVKLVFAIKIIAENNERELKSGMPVDVKLDLD